MRRQRWQRPDWGIADAVAAALGLAGVIIVVAGGGLLGGIVAFAGMWLEFSRMYEVSVRSFGQSDDDDDEHLIHL